MSYNSKLEFIEKPSCLTNNIPLLVMLHGYGSDENDLFAFANELPDEYHIISLKAPFPMQPYGNAWYTINFDNEKGKWNNIPQAKTSVELVLEFIKAVVSKLNIDENNISLLGFSQGTILSYAIALNYPSMIKNIVGLSGYLDQEMIYNNSSQDELKNISCYVSHGEQDQVIPLDWAQNSCETLLLKGLNINFHTYPVGHGVSQKNFYDLREWLLKH